MLACLPAYVLECLFACSHGVYMGKLCFKFGEVGQMAFVNARGGAFRGSIEPQNAPSEGLRARPGWGPGSPECSGRGSEPKNAMAAERFEEREEYNLVLGVFC